VKYIGVVVVLLMVFNACSTIKEAIVVKPKVLPSWYTNPPKSNGKDLYSLGEGNDAQEATVEALSSLAATLSVSISSDYRAQTTVKEGIKSSVDARYDSDIKSEVKKIRISSYEIIESQSLGFKHYAVLIKVNKQKLFRSMKQELDQKFTIIHAQKKKIATLNAIKQLAYYRKTKKSLENLPDTLIVMNILNENFEGDEYIRQTQEISWLYQDLLQEISFFIVSNKNGSILKSSLAKGLSDKRFKIQKAQNKFHFTIYVNAKIQKANSYGFTLARSEISIITKDTKGVIVGTNSLNIVGQSSQGYVIAKQNVALRLRALIEKEGIAKVLGLDI